MSECIFCKIAKKEIPAEILYESEDIVAFPDINPKAPVHILIIPKKHLNPQQELDEADVKILPEIFLAAKKLAGQKNIKSFRFISNIGAEAGQEIEHLHFHLLGGRKMGSLG